MDEPLATDEPVSGEDDSLDGIDAEVDLARGEEPEVFLGEVPPEEDLAGTEPGSTAVATPIVANAPPAGGGDDALQEAHDYAPLTQPHPDHPIKIVLTLRFGRGPSESGSALVAAGIEGREPILRYLDSSDLAAILVVVPEVVAATIEASRRRLRTGSASAHSRSVSETPTMSTAELSTVARTQPTPIGRRAQSNESSTEQPSLFG